MNVDFLVSLIQGHEWLAYLIIFLISIPEGPLLTVFCAFLVTQDLLNSLVVYAIVVAGDMVGDSIWYGVGRFIGLGSRFVTKLGITPERMTGARKRFQTSRMKMLALSKLIHGAGVLGLVYAGSIRAPYGSYVLGCLCISLVQSAFLLSIGILVGNAYELVMTYQGIYAAVASALAIAVGGILIMRLGITQISNWLAPAE